MYKTEKERIKDVKNVGSQIYTEKEIHGGFTPIQ